MTPVLQTEVRGCGVALLFSLAECQCVEVERDPFAR
jgi:hypothetical protein